MLRKGRKHQQTASFAKGSVMLMQPEKTSYFSSGVICWTTESTRATNPMIKCPLWLGSKK